MWVQQCHKPSPKSQSGWWFQPLWKIWKSVGMILPNIWENKKYQKKLVTTNQQLSYVLIHWNWGSPIFSPCTAGHSWAQLGASSWRLCHRSTMMRFKRASWASRRSSRARAWAETKTWTWNHTWKIYGKSMEQLGETKSIGMWWDLKKLRINQEKCEDV